MKNTNKHTIWTNRLDLEEYRNSMPPEEIAGLTDEELTSRMCEENELWLSDEKENLSKIQYNEPLLIISDLGLWRGRFPGYKDVDSGKLTDCFSCTCGEFVEWYVDMYGNLRCDDTHHDGTNHHLVRVWKDGISDHLREKLHDAILSGHATPTLYGRYTNAVGKDIANVYVWKVRGMK